jgi:hypothetical protein
MSFPQVLEVAIGLILVYYIIGSIISTITQVVTEALETRGVALEKYLKIIAGDRIVDLTNMHQIQSLKPIRFKNWLSVFTASTEPKMVEKIPAPILVDAFFDMAGLTANKEISGDELINLIGELPESEGKQAMLGWIRQGVTNINDIRARTTAYFSGLMDQASATFKARARSIVIILSIALTFFLGTDSIQLFKDLWTNAELRAVAAAQASAVVQQGGAQADLTSLLDDLSKLSIRIGWWRTQNLPADGSIGDWVSFILLKIIGLGLTVVAVSQGSSFWYDLLKKLTGQSSSPKSVGEGGDAKG